MSEFIVCVDDFEESYYKHTDIKPDTVFGYRLYEEIVRCHDCKKLNIVGECPCGFWALENLNGFCAGGEKEVI